MSRLDERSIEIAFATRSTAGEEVRSKLVDWSEWTCSDPEFRYAYDRTVTLFVHSGAAVVTFSDGTSVGLRPGDTMTIRKGAEAVWSIAAPIHNSYTYHDEA